ncbi:hypothetical protein G647_01735 [Cladophialophora carrionii CBS 160.54]|uniref:Cytochrome c oxidase-assembly factor COX23, mitochondrial n=1 Tax=Cladophialophora carrionii CBS 160.54 TaxID=1279043 RepID=V9DTG9_9EURO|nr:uncharacterized protein G647_01735 [Cladophialophora carrionii CBS 160.54]ETI29282.1 hypothetical protein G647_01735 [Cladophialophora carrionii CBS 160.54]
MATSAQSQQMAGSDAQADTWEKSKAAFQSKRSSEYYDPCQDFANKSIKCMHRNNGDRDMCQDYFKAYRDCKKEWMARRKAEKGSWFS